MVGDIQEAERTQLIDQLSIIIVTWNGAALLEACLRSLRAVYHDRSEVVVVDNAATDATRSVCNVYANVKYIPVTENLGFAGGNNVGLRHCTRDYILLLNNDTLIKSDSFTPLLEFLRANPKVGIVQGTMNIPALGDGLDDCGTMMTPFGIQRHLHRGDPSATTKLSPRKVTAAKGAMLMFKRQVVEQTTFLFYDHFKSYFEETDFCRRAANCGWETWFVPTPPIDHLCGATSTRFDRDEIWIQYFRNIIFSFARNWGRWGRFVMLPLFCCAAFDKSPRNLVKASREKRG